MTAMLGVALSDVRGLLNDLLEKLSGKDWEIWLAEFKKFLRKEPCWVVEPLLELLGIITIPATTDRFVAKEKFVRNTSDEAEVKIVSISYNFTEWFLFGNGKIEEPLVEQTLHCHKLKRSSAANPIITELGGEAKVEVCLSEVYSLMAKQPKGEEGVLIINSDGRSNIFYVRDCTDVLRPVFVVCLNDGWHINALSVWTPNSYRDGGRVFSRI